MDLYKIVGPAGECRNGGSGDWSLPTATEPGEWREVTGDIVPCRNGLHLATATQVPQWYSPGSVVYRVETDGPLVNAGDKWVAARVRLLPRKTSGKRPDMAREAVRLSRAEAAARRKLERVKPTAAIPPQWRAYLLASYGSKLPPGHPAIAYGAMLAADERRRVAAEREYEATVAAARDRHNAAAMAEVLPD